MSVTSVARPESDDTAVWTPSSGTSRWAMVDEVVPDEDTTYIYAQNANASQRFGFSGFSGVTASDVITINSFTIYGRPRKTSASTALVYYPRLRVGIDIYNGDVSACTDSYAWYSTTWTTNPHTGNPWEPEDLEIGGSGASTVNAIVVRGANLEAGEEIRLTTAYWEVDYDSYLDCELESETKTKSSILIEKIKTIILEMASKTKSSLNTIVTWALNNNIISKTKSSLDVIAIRDFANNIISKTKSSLSATATKVFTSNIISKTKSDQDIITILGLVLDDQTKTEINLELIRLFSLDVNEAARSGSGIDFELIIVLVLNLASATKEQISLDVDKIRRMDLNLSSKTKTDIALNAIFDLDVDDSTKSIILLSLLLIKNLGVVINPEIISATIERVLAASLEENTIESRTTERIIGSRNL